MTTLLKHARRRGADDRLMTPRDRQLEAAFEQFLKLNRGRRVADLIFGTLRGRTALDVTESVYEIARRSELPDGIFSAPR